MKAVRWTDTVQVIIMFISMAVVGFMRLFLKMFEYFLTIASTVRPNATSIFNRWYLKGTLTKVVVQLYGQQTKLQIAWNLESMLLVYVLSTFQNHILKIVFSFDPSPAKRHSVWSLIVGGYFTVCLKCK